MSWKGAIASWLCPLLQRTEPSSGDFLGTSHVFQKQKGSHPSSPEGWAPALQGVPWSFQALITPTLPLFPHPMTGAPPVLSQASSPI